MTFRIASCVALAVLLAGCGGSPQEGHDTPTSYEADGHADAAAAEPDALTVEAPWIRLPPPPAPVAAGYLQIANGEGDDRLLGVETAAAERVEIHEMRETDGVMQMRERVDGVVVPSRGRVALAPGGDHLMLIAPDAGLAPGTQVEATLVFERAGRVPVTFEVRSATEQPAGHGDHGAHGTAHGEDGHGH
ncbi:copper chaperone PCu(A)C [Luteimonas abyssi]|uniref:copper chaperone PCu(A)C n=1 Tax=Luteimonas abyssi TaxID=1247514 RepID=UPI000A50F2EE|nr:copper chaperone PCu(A)C [Luteimonas abyssi]